MTTSKRAERLARKEEERKLQEIQSEIERKQCLNCDTPLDTNMKFCYNCGQKNIDRRVPMKELLAEFSKDYLTFDSKFFRSFIPLLFRPGHLTTLFTNGKRVTFIPPIRLYVFISVVYFFAVSFDNTRNDISVENGTTPLDSIAEQSTDGVSITLDPESREALGEDNFFVKKVDALANMTYKEKRQLVNRAISILMFLLMPYLAMLLGIFYRKKKRYYVEHLIFSIHFHSFYFLLQLLLLIAGWLVDGPYSIILILTTAVYLFFALLKMYENKWWLNLIKFFGLIIVYLFGAIFLLGIGFAISIIMS